ncbi:transport protein Avl9-domain-containing protein [Catenaria anguillulae PL171]|uniref:Transport protein Avl9-domain-containing protein n=1 Tax=Catenaria anguillulae PL171 TaxID=765915 RepID=A0A1Y2HMK1_9FUNG|nr:transport protein Avl9-domain-containing protein [Catenaria anguillulae PL171]
MASNDPHPNPNGDTIADAPTPTPPIADKSSAHASAITTATATATMHGDSIVKHICVIAFHHTLGPILEWAHPPLPRPPPSTANSSANTKANNSTSSSTPSIELPSQWSAILPFCALPDGAHSHAPSSTDQSTPDPSGGGGAANAFSLPPVPEWAFAQETVFASSYYRQIPASDLLVKPADVTRHMVQKAVVVLSTEPAFGALRPRLEQITQRWFATRDLTQRDLLVEFFDALKVEFAQPVKEEEFSNGMHLRDLVMSFKSKVLVLYKLVLLQKRICFFSTSIEHLINTQLSLLYLFPDLLFHMHHTGHPSLSPPSSTDRAVHPCIQLANPPTPFSDPRGNPLLRRDLLHVAGLPLALFSKGTLVQPYLPLQQLDSLAVSPSPAPTATDTDAPPQLPPVMIGTTNQIVRDFAPARFDAIISCDPPAPGAEPRIEFLNAATERAANSLTPPDKKWIQALSARVAAMVDQGDTGDVINTMVRGEFEQYLVALMAVIQAGANVPGVLPGTTPEDPADLAASTRDLDVAAPRSEQSADNLIQSPPTSPGTTTDAEKAAAAERAAAEKAAADRRKQIRTYHMHLLSEFSSPFIAAYLATPAHAHWLLRVHATFASDLFSTPYSPAASGAGAPLGHPCQGHTLAQHLNDQLKDKIAELNLDEKKKMVQQGLAAAVQSASGYAAKLKEEASKRAAANDGSGVSVCSAFRSRL